METGTGYPSKDKPWLKYYTEEEINARPIEGSMYEYVLSKNQGKLDQIALHYFGRNISYKELFQNINKAADAFEKMGVKEGDIISVCLLHIPEMVYTFYGLNQIGAVVNFIDLGDTVGAIHKSIENVKSKLVICQDAVYRKVVSATRGLLVSKVIVIEQANSLTTWKKTMYHLKTGELIEYDDYVISWNSFISQGNIKPDFIKNAKLGAMMSHKIVKDEVGKDIMLSNENINYMVHQASQRVKQESSNVHMTIEPPHYATGFCFGIHFPLVMGMRNILIPVFEPNKFSQYINKYKPGYFTCTPSLMEYLLQCEKNLDLSTLRMPAVCWEFFSEEQENKINKFFEKHKSPVRIFKGYGTLEASTIVTFTSEEHNDVKSVGYPMVHTTVSIFKPGTEEELTYGESGEICISGPTAMLGYYKDDKGTEEIKKVHSDGTVWIHSGDMGYMKEDGLIYLIDSSEDWDDK